MFDNIAAISSGMHMNQPISIVRLSGPDAVEIIKKIYKGKVGSDHQITYGHIWDFANNQVIDEVLVMWFVGSNKDGKIVYNNYVGEPLIEINCHGGIVVTNLILELLLKNGARLAEPGEFTKRAFLNGKMDLVKANAIHDLIFAQTSLQAKGAINKFNGKTSTLIDKLTNEISYTIGLCEVNIDYPEYLDPIYTSATATQEKILQRLKEHVNALNEIVQVSESARYIFEGVKVALVGKPNVGKSSLLNALLAEDKAIVTDIAGTTRDIIEASYQIKGMLFKLVDTAGIRKTNEKIESLGIEKSFQQIEQADLVVHLLDPNQPWDEFDSQIQNLANQKNKIYLQVMNKSDLTNESPFENALTISAKENKIDQLEQALVKNFEHINLLDEKIIANTRQLSLIKQAQELIQNAYEQMQLGLTYDVIIIDLYAAWDALKNVTGDANREDLLDDMFSTFCLGK